MMEKLWYHLNISTENSLRDDFIFPEKRSGHGIHWKYSPMEIFTDEWYGNFKETLKFDGDVIAALFFCENSNTNDYAHIDINEKHFPVTPVPAAFNWVYGGAGSSMVWYDQWSFEEKDLWYGKTDYEWSVNDPNRRAPGAAIWRANSLKEISRLEVPRDNVVLVNTGVAHRIELGPEDRWCVSIRLPFNSLDNWGSYVNMVKSVIKE